MNIKNIFSANTRVTELEKEKAQLAELVQLTQKDLADAQDTIGNFMETQKQFTTELEATKAEYESKITALEIQLAEVAGSTNTKAATIVASLGVEAEAIPQNVEVKTNVLAELERRTGVDKHEYYQNNREAILRATGLLK